MKYLVDLEDQGARSCIRVGADRFMVRDNGDLVFFDVHEEETHAYKSGFWLSVSRVEEETA